MASGDVEFGSDVQFTGTLMTTGSLKLSGTNTHLHALSLPQLDGSAGSTELPVAIVEQSLVVESEAVAFMTGLVMSWGGTIVKAGATGNFDLTGQLATSRFRVEPRPHWSTLDSWWTPKLASWAYDEAQGFSYDTFPYVLSAYGISPTPQIQIDPSSTAPNYHWHDWTGGVFRIGATDSALRWRIVNWRSDD